MSGSPTPRVNEDLREYVTRVGFDLTLAKTHVEFMVFLDEMLRRKVYIRSPSWFVSAFRGCERRGLVWYRRPSREQSERRRAKGRTDLTGIYGFTRAGRLVLSLMKEAGVYEEKHRQLFGLEVVEQTA